MPLLLLLSTFGLVLTVAAPPAGARPAPAGPARAERAGGEKTPGPGETGGTVERIRRLDPFATTAAMAGWVAAAVGNGGTPRARLERLEAALLGADGLAMTESLERTPSAAEAWSRRAANCLGLALLAVGLGRRAGLDLEVVEMRADAELEARAEVRLMHRHVAAAWADGTGYLVLDFAGLAALPAEQVTVLTDHQARGLYFGNRGAEALLAGNARRAVPWLEAAVELVERDWLWRNLALALLRSGRPAAAAAARAQARRISGSPSGS